LVTTNCHTSRTIDVRNDSAVNSIHTSRATNNSS
jgi:hypothetical protein